MSMTCLLENSEADFAAGNGPTTSCSAWYVLGAILLVVLRILGPGGDYGYRQHGLRTGHV